MTNTSSESSPSAREGLTRRSFLGTAGAAMLTSGGALALAGCGSSSSTPGTGQASSTTPAGSPKHGGQLRVGLTGGGSTETLDPAYWADVTDYARVQSLFDPLVTFNSKALPELILAEEITPNSDATEWTIRVRDDVTFHNGKSLTADDVAFTIRRMLNPKRPGYGALYLGPVDAANIKKLDNRTIRVPFKSPFAIVMQALASAYYHVVPVGFDPKHPIGTGAFKYVSFTPGQASHFTRNPSYWQSPLPYVDDLIMTDYTTQVSQINALVGNEIDALNGITTAGISPVQQGGGKVVISQTGAMEPFCMRADIAPTNDVRVRQAIRLVFNRPQMLKLLFGGHGALGNDTWGLWDPAYDHSLPQRHQDLEQAKHLLKAAGQESLRMELDAAPLTQDSIQAAEVFARDASLAGIKVSVKQLTVTELYGSNYTKWPFSVDLAYYLPYLIQIAIAGAPDAPFDQTHWHPPAYLSMYHRALRTVDDQARGQIIQDMQKLDYDQGGYGIPYFSPLIDGYRSTVQGVVSSRSGASFNGWDFKRLWLS